MTKYELQFTHNEYYSSINPGVLGNCIYVTLRYNFLQCCVIFVTICIRKKKKKKEMSNLVRMTRFWYVQSKYLKAK